MSFGLSEIINVANWADKADIAGVTNGRGRISCQVFSKDLIVRAIGKPPPTPPKGYSLYTSLFNKKKLKIAYAINRI